MVPSYAGSNPAAPANEKYLSLPRVFFICLVARVLGKSSIYLGVYEKAKLAIGRVAKEHQRRTSGGDTFDK